LIYGRKGGGNAALPLCHCEGSVAISVGWDCFGTGVPRNDIKGCVPRNDKRGCVIAPFLLVIASEAWQSQTDKRRRFFALITKNKKNKKKLQFLELNVTNGK